MTLSGAATLGHGGPGSDGNEVVLHILQSSCNTGTSPSDCLVSYPRHLLGRVLPADWAKNYFLFILFFLRKSCMICGNRNDTIHYALFLNSQFLCQNTFLLSYNI